MPKMTIYLPEDLFIRVAGAGLNVSAICQAALGEQIRQLETKARATRDIQVVAARLRATEKEEEERDYERGFDLGAEWARETATLSELREVAALDRQDWTSYHFDGTHSLLYFMWEDYDDDRRDAIKVDLDSFMRGVVAGASEVYSAAKPHLR